MLSVLDLKNMFISGLNCLFNHQYEINRLNVFPVPDGDTGTNMFLTFNNGVKKILSAKKSTQISELLSDFATGLVMGARGNSGVILSQIFKGFDLAFSDKKIDNNKFEISDFQKSLELGTEAAYKSVMKPVEGTILTVVKETSKKILKIDGSDSDFKKVFNDAYLVASDTLKKTPDYLEILKESNVVDSGGAGLVYILEGMNYFLANNKQIKKLSEPTKTKEGVQKISLDEVYGYCTETIIMLKEKYLSNFQISSLQDGLKLQGCKSIVTALAKKVLKVHAHTLFPGKLIDLLQKYGEFKEVKVDNMNLQSFAHSQEITSNRDLINEYAIIAFVSTPELKTYFTKDLKIKHALLSKRLNSKLSTKDILEEIAATNAKNIYIFPNDKDLVLASEQAAKIEKLSTVNVIKTENIAEGVVGIINFDSTLQNPKKNVSVINKAISELKTAKIMKVNNDIKYYGKDLKKGNYFAVLAKHRILQEKTLNLLIKEVLSKLVTKNSEILSIFKGKNLSHTDLKYIEKYVEENFDLECDIINTNQELYDVILSIE